jgi:hypothetical protein
MVYIGKWNWDGKPGGETDGVLLEIKNDGTFSAFLSGSMNDWHSGTYTVASSNANDIRFSIQVQNSLHDEHPAMDSGLSGGTLEWFKDSDNGKETVVYSYTHVGGRGERFRLEKDK